MNAFSTLDVFAFVWFVAAWLGFGYFVDQVRVAGPSLTQLMDRERRAWMEVLLRRDNRIVDSAIMGSLQNGTAFFASSSLIALGASFTLLNQSERMVEIFNDLPFHVEASRGALEAKIVGLVAIYGYAFFKFGWAYRLFNYTAILIGAVPPASERDTAEAWAAARRAAEMQIDAGHHFHWGLRSLFFSIGYFGWFVNAWVFLCSSTLILLVLARRQYLSRARAALIASGVEPDQGAGKSALERPSSR
ncbi:MAG: DUF599 family protein [Hyphomicrobiales bacterium]|nr:DUF599 family protein [Hyphomicrobiales bacterium]